MKDIAPELIQKIKNEFEKKIKGSNKIKALEDILKSGESNYMIANDYAIEVGDILAEIFKTNISSNILPDGRMYYNIAERLLNDRLKENYNLIAYFTKETQTQINKKMGLNIKGVKPEINQDRIDGIIDRISNEENYDVISWILDEPVKNFSQSIVDDSVAVNVRNHYNLGLRPKIIRKESGSCCDWCRQVVGEYEYPDLPDDIYKRHRYCRCTVEYDPGTGKRQNVHTKKWRNLENNDNKGKRKQVNIKVKDINKKDDVEQYRRYASVLGYENMPKSLPLFQEIKYNNIIDYEKLKSIYHVKNNIKNGAWGKKINKEKQSPHNELTREFGKSYLFENVNPQELFDRYAGRGILQKTLTGKYSNKEICSSDIEIGIDFRTGKETKMFKIHHSKNRTHIVPYIEKE